MDYAYCRRIMLVASKNYSFASHFLRNGGNLLSLQAMLGHSDFSMVKRYARIVDAGDAHHTIAAELIATPGLTADDVPDVQLKNMILSSIVHCWLTARNRENGRLVEPWIAPDCYGALDSESQMITRGMDVWGQHDYATRSLEFWLGRCPAGFFVSGYTYGPGTGQFLWTLMDHYQLTRDKAWLKTFLQQKGVPADKIDTMGAGKTQPAQGVKCEDKLPRKKLIECLAPSRRVVVEVKGTAK